MEPPAGLALLLGMEEETLSCVFSPQWLGLSGGPSDGGIDTGRSLASLLQSLISWA